MKEDIHLIKYSIDLRIVLDMTCKHLSRDSLRMRPETRSVAHAVVGAVHSSHT